MAIEAVAFYFTRITDLPRRQATFWRRFRRVVGSEDPLSAAAQVDAGWATLLTVARGTSSPLRVYFGNEFCEHRIPAEAEFEASVAEVRAVGLPFTFVTPPVTDPGLERLAGLFARLEALLPGSEVVVGDWGTARILQERFTSLKPVLGRLLVKFLRDPRLTPRFLLPDSPPASLIAFQQCSVTLPGFREVLGKLGIDRVELDNLFQGMAVDFAGLGLRPAVHVPFGYVTRGRICLIGNQHLAAEQKFGALSRCRRECLKVEVRLRDRNRRADGGVYDYVQRGNTVFYEQTGPHLMRALAWAATQGARLVFSPELPF